jgi:CspA family cold shock protein
MPTGKVTFFHDRKGYGFIETPASDEDIFFHVEDIEGPEPQEGEELEFKIEDAPRGPRAKQLERFEG